MASTSGHTIGASYGTNLALNHCESDSPEEISVKGVWHTGVDTKAEVTVKPNQAPVVVSMIEIATELNSLSTREAERRLFPNCNEPPEAEMKDITRKVELLKIREAVQQRCEFLSKMDHVKSAAWSFAQLGANVIAAPPRHEESCYMPLYCDTVGDGIELETVIHVTSSLPLEDPEAGEYGSTAGIEVKELVQTGDNIMATVTVQPDPHPFTVSWLGMFVELKHIANRQRRRQESSGLESSSEGFKKDNARAWMLLRIRHAIRQACKERQEVQQRNSNTSDLKHGKDQDCHKAYNIGSLRRRWHS